MGQIKMVLGAVFVLCVGLSDNNGVLLAWQGLLGLQWCLGGRCGSQRHPHKCQ